MSNKPKPKTGEKRKTRQPFKIDLLPQAVRDKILDLRNKEAKTWTEIEALSHDIVPWTELKLEVLEEFPDLKLPKSNLQRWYDVRIEQVHAEVLEEAKVFDKFTQRLAGRDVKGDARAVVNALRTEVMRLKTMYPGSPAAFMAGLNTLSLALVRIERLEISKVRAAADLAKNEAERAKWAAETGDPKEIYLQASTTLLKQLMTHASLRGPLEALQEEIVREMSSGADEFAKQVEARAA